MDTQPTTIISGLYEPRGLSVDWIAKRVYITDSSRILVTTLDGKLTYTVLSGDMQQPRDIVVAPVQGVLFWSDWGPVPRIETAYMDGNKRQVLVLTGLLWPTGLAADHPAMRIYWADPKTGIVESCKYDGSDRQIVRRFNSGE